MNDHVANIHREAGTHIGGPNLGFAGTEGSTILTISLPNDGTAGAKDDGATHATKLEQRELDALSNGIPNLRTPASVTVGGEAMVLVRAGWDGIHVRLRIRGVRKRHKGVQRCTLRGTEGEAVVNGGMYIL